MRPSASRARRRACCPTCTRAMSSMKCSATTSTRRSSMSCSGKKVMTENTAFKAKKSVALSGVTAGNTALCTVGRTGNDLHYRGYDILEIASVSEFEEIAHLLIHGKLPNRAELAAYKMKL